MQFLLIYDIIILSWRQVHIYDWWWIFFWEELPIMENYLDPQFVSLLNIVSGGNLFSMMYDHTQQMENFIEKLTGDKSHYRPVIALLNTMGLSIANKDSIRDPKTVWPRSSRVPDALNILAMALAYQASLNPKFKKFASVEAVKEQLDLMDRCLSEHWLALYDLRVGLRWSPSPPGAIAPAPHATSVGGVSIFYYLTQSSNNIIFLSVFVSILAFTPIGTTVFLSTCPKLLDLIIGKSYSSPIVSNTIFSREISLS